MPCSVRIKHAFARQKTPKSSYQQEHLIHLGMAQRDSRYISNTAWPSAIRPYMTLLLLELTVEHNPVTLSLGCRDQRQGLLQLVIHGHLAAHQNIHPVIPVLQLHSAIGCHRA